MTTLEQKAQTHAEKVFSEILDKYQTAPWNEFRDALAQIYLTGASEALAGQWKDPKEEMPEDEEYVLIDGPLGVEPAVWNEHFDCWDDAEGDDNMYKKEAVRAWMSIPQPPKDESHV